MRVCCTKNLQMNCFFFRWFLYASTSVFHFCATFSVQKALHDWPITLLKFHDTKLKFYIEVGVNILQASQEVCSQGAAAAGLWETMCVCVVKSSFPSSIRRLPAAFSNTPKTNQPRFVCVMWALHFNCLNIINIPISCNVYIPFMVLVWWLDQTDQSLFFSFQ